jgi:hypothetical protein
MKKIIGCVLFFCMLCFFSCDQGYEPINNDDDDYTEEQEEEAGELPAFEGLAGTKWLWGQSLLEFDGAHAVFRGDASMPYPYTVSAMEDGAAGGGTITTLGAFTVNAARDTLEIVNYRTNSGSGSNMMDTADNERRGHSDKPYYNAVFKRKNPETMVVPTGTMLGTEWNVGSTTNGTRFAASQYIIFFTEDECVNQSGNYVFVNFWTFDRATRRGWIEYITHGDTKFSINSAWSTLFIASYKEYSHSMDCARVR